MNDVLRAIHQRRSTRRYLEKPVERDVLQTIIDGGLWAPSASNRQPWHFTVVTDAKLIERMDQMGKQFYMSGENEQRKAAAMQPDFTILFHAPCVILVSGTQAGNWQTTDCALATQNILLAAHSLGLGTCVIGLMTPVFAAEAGEKLMRELKLPEGYRPLHMITLGYGDPSAAQRIPDRAPHTVVYVE